jgi:hypothetical protein
MRILTPPSSAYRFLGVNRQTSFHLVLRHKPRNYHDDFKAKITKSPTLILRHKSRNRRGDFEAKINKTPTLILKLKSKKLS